MSVSRLAPPRSGVPALLTGALVLACSTEAPLGVAREYIRPTDPSASGARFLATDVVEQYGSPGGEFLVHYTRAGVNAVPSADADGSGVPDFVETVGATYDEALAFFEADGFARPLGDGGFAGGDGGDGRFDVYLVDFGGIGDGAFRRDGCLASAPSQCFGHMVQDEDFEHYPLSRRGEAIRILASHELFHAIQAAYDADLPAVFSEGTAVWASEHFDPALGDLEDFSGAYLSMTSRSLDVAATPPSDSFTYGSGVVFLFLDERFGADVMRRLFEDLVDGARGISDPEWVPTLDALLARDEGTSWRAALEELAEWSLSTDARADPTRSFARGAGLAPLGMTEVTLPYVDDRDRMLPSSYTVYWAAPLGRSEMTAAIVPTPGSTDREDLSVIVARLGSTSVLEVVHATDPTAAPPLSIGTGEVFVAMVVRANDAASMHVPGICIGTPDEVRACRDSLTPAADAGLPDAGTPEADAGPAGDGGTMAPAPAGCACRAARAPAPPVWALIALAAALRARGGRRRAAGRSEATDPSARDR